MTPKGKYYKPEYAMELLNIAEGDLGSARALSRVTEGRPENICYMAQQCAERSLKAVLCHFGKLVIHTHDFESLVSHLPGDVLPLNHVET